MNLGLSQQNRHQYVVNTQLEATGASLAAVRPPIDYWPWTESAETPAAARAAARAAIVDRVVVPQEPPKNKAESRVEALRRALMGPRPDTNLPPAPPPPAASAAPVQRTVRRGLPLTPRRHGRTWAGPKTSPGGMATGAAPQPTNSVSPTRFGGVAPEPLPAVARTGVSDADGPAAAPAARAPSREERLRTVLQQTGALSGNSAVPNTVSADQLVQKYASAPNRPDAGRAMSRPAEPGPGFGVPRPGAHSELRGLDVERPDSVLGRAIAPQPFARPSPGAPLIGSAVSPSAGRAEARSRSLTAVSGADALDPAVAGSPYGLPSAAESLIRQGVTLDVFGEASMGPITDTMRAEYANEQMTVRYQQTWSTLGETPARFENAATTVYEPSGRGLKLVIE